IAIGRARWSFESCQGVSDPDVLRALEIGAFCNSARLLGGEQDKEKIRWLGDPTEGALLVAAVQAGLLPRAEEPQTLHELPFDSERRAMSIVLRLPEEGLRMYTKGAAETVLEFCNSEWAAGQRQPLEPGRIEEIRETEGRMAAEGLRVLAVAFKELRGDEPDAFQEKRLTFVGLAGLNDPPRPEVRAAVLKARQAGIRTVMITGDHPATARAIARELHMCREEDEAVSGAELDKLTDEELAGRVEAIAVYSRVTAHHKLRVVRAWKARGQIVAMTGDGVNDAAAVKIADVGIAMGVSGTDVTRGASDIVLTDDNFASIVAAVEQGRTVLENIQKFLHFQLAGNVGGVLVMFIAALAGLPPPLTAIHLLWINLILDGLPALALGLEPPEMDVMTRPPRPPREPVIAWELGTRILRHGALIGLVVMTGFLLTLAEGGSTLHAQTIAFALLAFTRIAFSFCCRSQRRTMPVLGILSNPHLAGALALSGALQCVVLGATWARAAFGVSVLPLAEWLLVLALALVPVTLIELNKVRSAGQAPGHVGIVPRESRKSANG
ncbi:MAG: cation-translocating P-type ATPase, partial [Candidatus Wallbacteria bacterium]|nr:cation-translocating P-type ATPase [Candidatus Wallbacteria bacterium]